MSKELAAAKKELREKSNVTQAYSLYLAVPISLIIILALAMLDVNIGNPSTVILVLVVMGHIRISKLTLLSNKKYIAPILYYLTNIIVLICLFAIFLMPSVNEFYLFLGITGLVAVPLEIVISVFYFITANDIKKAYPNMNQEVAEARKKYQMLKKMD